VDGRGKVLRVDNLAGSSKLLRAMNSSAALSLLFERGRVTRGDLREATGLSKPTVSDALRRLVEANLAIVAGHQRGGPGPNAEIYAINPDAAYAAAVSVREGLDGPSVAAALCDLTGAVRGRFERPIDLGREDPVAVVTSAVNAVSRATSPAVASPDGGPRLARVQLGVAGSFDPGTRTIHHIDLAGFDRPGLVDALAEHLGAPVDVDNDVNLATVAERRHGCAADADGFALLWLGEGVGLGIDLGGALLRGARGGAGEIGYMPLRDPSGGPDDPLAADLHDLISGSAARALAARYGHTGRTTEEAVARAVGDPEFLTTFADRVAVGLAAVVAVLDPALVVLAGPVAVAGGTALRDGVVAALSRAAPLETTVEVTAVDGDPVVLGGLDAALTAVRDQLVAALRQPAPSPT